MSTWLVLGTVLAMVIALLLDIRAKATVVSRWRATLPPYLRELADLVESSERAAPADTRTADARMQQYRVVAARLAADRPRRVAGMGPRVAALRSRRMLLAHLEIAGHARRRLEAKARGDVMAAALIKAIDETSALVEVEQEAINRLFGGD